MNKLLIIPLLVFTSCASQLTKQDLTFTYVEKTNVSAENGYNLALQYFAKNLKNSNQAIQLKDPKRKKLISQIGIRCDDVKNGMLDIASYTTYFTVEADFKDNKARFSIKGDSYTSGNIDGSLIAVDAPFRSHQKDGLKVCADKVKELLLESLAVTNNTDW